MTRVFLVLFLFTLSSCEALQGLEKAVTPKIEVHSDESPDGAPLIVWSYRLEAPAVGDWVVIKDVFYKVLTKTYAPGRTVLQVAQQD